MFDVAHSPEAMIESTQRLPHPYSQCERTHGRATESSIPEMWIEDMDGTSSMLPWMSRQPKLLEGLLKEVIQPQVPLRLPCYDFTPVTDLAVDAPLLSVGVTASGAVNSRGVTGGVYKARERIHRVMLLRDY